MSIEELQLHRNLIAVRMVLGPAYTNAYLLGEPEGETAVVIDPAWSGEIIHDEAERRGWVIGGIWLTHAHFDHFGGVAALVNRAEHDIPVALHPKDQALWNAKGGAGFFGVPGFDPGPEPSEALEEGTELRLGDLTALVRHTPGHTPGHVMFYFADVGAAFCGDLVFQGSVGRTDLPGGDWNTLLKSIREQVLTLPNETRLFSGHGPPTTVGQERVSNPFVKGDFHL